jgi:ABC-type glycerol-3-phosphate transport system substrate-binding protein
MGTQAEKPAVSRRKFLQGMAGLAGASLLAACGGAAAPTGGGTAPTAAGAAAGAATAAPAAGGAAQATVEWWDSQTGVDEEITKKMIDTFQQKNPDIKINRTFIAQVQGTQANEKLLTSIAGGNPPDIYKFDRFIVAQFAAQDFLTDLTDMASKAGVKQDDYWPFAWEEANYNGKLYALPYDTDTRALWYNKNIFKEVGLDPEKPPQNITELADMSAKLMKKDANGKITRFGFNPITDQAWGYTYGFAWKGEFQDAATKKITTANPKVVESMKWLADFAKSIGTDQLDAFVAACAGSNCNDANDYFWTGQNAMVVSGDWKVAQAKKYKPDVQYGVVPFPGPDGPAPYASWAGGWSWVIPKGAKNVEAAFKVLSWVAGPEGQDMFNKATYHIPTNKKTAADPFYSADPLHKVFMDLLPVSHTRPPIPAGSLLWDELVKARDAIWHGTSTPEDALKAVDDKVNAELDKLGFFKK